MADTVVHGRRPGEEPSYQDELFELLRILVVAGIPVGVVLAGLGSRLAMFVLRLTSPDYVRGLESDDGFTMGQFTLGGTYNLIVVGAVVGVVGAAAYIAVAPWLLGPSWFRRLTVGLTAGALVGAMVVHSDGVDFQVLEPLWFAVALFVGLPFVVGIALTLAVDRAAMPGSWAAEGQRRQIVPAVLAALVVPAMIVVIPVFLVVAALLPVRRALLQPLRASAVGAYAVRAVFLTIPIASAIALGQDLGDLF